MKTDEDIAKQVQSGNFELFSILIERYEAKMKRYAHKFLFKNEEAEDVLQDIFIKAYKNIKRFDTKRKFSSWLYRIAHNELINALKKRKKTFPLPDLDTFFPFHFDREKELNRDLGQNVGKCLNKLKPKYREVIILFFYEELSYKEIADILEIPIATVGIRLKRAKETIKKTYEHH